MILLVDNDDGGLRVSEVRGDPRNPGLHLTPGPLSRRLREQGLRSGSARTTALIDLTRRMHPRIVSDLLGITPASAAAWSRLASGDWTDYPGLRSAPGL